MLGTVLIVILILALLGALPRWSHSRTGVMPLPKEWVSSFWSSVIFSCSSGVSSSSESCLCAARPIRRSFHSHPERL